MVFDAGEMNVVTNREELRERYALQYGVTAGQLPSSLDGLDDWLEALIGRVEDPHTEHPPEHPSVQAMRELIDGDRRVRGLVTLMIEQAGGQTRSGEPPVKDVDQMLAVLNHILTFAPTPDNAFPVSGLFLHMMFTPAGWFAFRNQAFNDSLRTYLQAYEGFLNSPESRSVINQVDGWLAPPSQRTMSLKDFEIDWSDPHGGFGCYNAFFHRQIKPEVRQLAGEHERDVIVSANDGVVYKISRMVQLEAKFWTKDQPYSLSHMLGDWAPRFVDGDVFQTFLAGSNYHRWMAPVAGTVVEATVVPGLMFSELLSVGWDTGGGTKSTAYEASVNTRAITIIDSGDDVIGLVAVIPIGITEVSSVQNVYADDRPVTVGDEVGKGQEIGRFSLGGSTLALVFQPGAIKRFRYHDVPAQPSATSPSVSARDWIALAY